MRVFGRNGIQSQREMVSVLLHSGPALGGSSFMEGAHVQHGSIYSPLLASDACNSAAL